MTLLRGIVLGLWTLSLGFILVVGRYSLFIRAELWPLLAGTLLMFVLLLGCLFGIGHGAGGRRIRPAALLQAGMLLLPVAYMFATLSGASASSGLNRFAFQKRSLNAGGFDSTDALTTNSANFASPDGVVQSIGYIARHFSSMLGRHVITEGRVVRDENDPANQTTLYRFVVVCCAADAVPVQVMIKSPEIASLKEDSWVRVEGILSSQDATSGKIPVITATRLKEIPAPLEPYLSPNRW